MEDRRVIIFDVETTGTDKRRDQVIELCVQFGVEGGASQTWRIRPQVAISPGAQAVHGISMEDLECCPTFSQLAGAIREVFAEAKVLIGYNLAFDIDMLQAEFDRAELPRLDLAGKEIIDAFRLWQNQEPRSLQDAHRRFAGGEFSAAHSAAADVAATGRVLVGMLSHFGIEGDWSEIARICEPERDAWVGPSRHIKWDDEGRLVIGFGKHEGVPLSVLADGAERGYLQWIANKDFPLHVRDICLRALELDAEQLADWVRNEYGARSRPKAEPAATAPVVAADSAPAPSSASRGAVAAPIAPSADDEAGGESPLAPRGQLGLAL